MSLRKKSEDEDSAGSWLNTYSDMVTLLLTFFIVLYSMSSVNQTKFQAMVKTMTGNDPNAKQLVVINNTSGTGSNSNSGYINDPNAKGNALPSTMDELYQYLASYVKENKKEADVEVTKNGPGTVYIKFSNSMMFKPDDYVLTSDAKENLDFLGKGLKHMESKVQRIQVEGHTADTQIPDYPVNDWRLSGERAASVVTYLNENKKIKNGLFISIGCGKTQPIASNDTEAGRVKNRRVEIKIYGTEADLKSDNGALNGTYDKNRYPTSDGGSAKPSPKISSKTASAAAKSKTASSQASTQSAVSPK
ncbi:MAG: flagellar motor protein MotB [Oscillospiraceae bacterium]|jgi:chemotaxis protein MotB|nr:flagellar motor protein MotB [Oscillospiraceae bacterium]